MHKIGTFFLCCVLSVSAVPILPVSIAAADEENVCAQGAVLEDGVYTAKFETDSSMFHVNETKDGQGVLTVKDGEMTIHVSLASKGILNLYVGLAEEAEADEENWLAHTEDTVTYSDGLSETVYGFDIPVPYLDEEFDCALIGKKGVWYDHRVSVSDAVLAEGAEAVETSQGSEAQSVEVMLSGGSGRASMDSPCKIELDEEGQYWATVVWSSPNYEFMLVDGEQYDPIQEDGNSTFRIPVELDAEMEVSAQTIAMSEPHLIDYTLYFDGSTLGE